MILSLARLLLLRRFGGRGLILLAVANFLRRRLLGRKAPPPAIAERPKVYEPPKVDAPPGADEAAKVYQPSQGSSQTVQRTPR
jgi:hypothetical protein